MPDMDHDPDVPDAVDEAAKSPLPARTVRSEDLLQGSRELLIVHGTETYRLLRTRNDKLILQK